MGEMGHSVHLGARAAAHVREQVAEELLPVEGLGELHEEQIEERLRRPTRAAAPLLKQRGADLELRAEVGAERRAVATGGGAQERWREETLGRLGGGGGMSCTFLGPS